MAGLRQRKMGEWPVSPSRGPLGPTADVPTAFCRADAPHPYPLRGTLVPGNSPGTAKLYPRWMALSLGGKSSLEFPAAPVHRLTLPGLACSNPAVTTWCSYFPPGRKEGRQTRLRPLWGQLHLGLPHQTAPLMMAFLFHLPIAAVNSKD